MKLPKLLLNTNVRAGYMFWSTCESATIHVINYIYFTTRILQPNGIINPIPTSLISTFILNHVINRLSILIIILN